MARLILATLVCLAAVSGTDASAKEYFMVSGSGTVYSDVRTCKTEMTATEAAAKIEVDKAKLIADGKLVCSVSNSAAVISYTYVVEADPIPSANSCDLILNGAQLKDICQKGEHIISKTCTQIASKDCSSPVVAAASGTGAVTLSIGVLLISASLMWR